jgi:hypothetical protein
MPIPTVAPAVESTMTAPAIANPSRIREAPPGPGSDSVALKRI